MSADKAYFAQDVEVPAILICAASRQNADIAEISWTKNEQTAAITKASLLVLDIADITALQASQPMSSVYEYGTYLCTAVNNDGNIESAPIHISEKGTVSYTHTHTHKY